MGFYQCLFVLIGYTKMRLPNLLEHDTIQEASQQAQYWVQLLKTGCSVVSILLFTYNFLISCLFTLVHICLIIMSIYTT